MYWVRVGRETINIQLVAKDIRACMVQRKPLLTTNHRRLRPDWAQRCQNLTLVAWSPARGFCPCLVGVGQPGGGGGGGGGGGVKVWCIGTSCDNI